MDRVARLRRDIVRCVERYERDSRKKVDEVSYFHYKEIGFNRPESTHVEVVHRERDTVRGIHLTSSEDE